MRMRSDVSGSPSGAWRPGMSLDESRGAPREAGGVIVIPVARRLVARWPGGAWVLAWPAAVEVRANGRTRRVRIVPVQSLALAALAGAALVALLGTIARWRIERAGKPEEGSVSR